VETRSADSLFSAGGTADFFARTGGEYLTQKPGQPVVVVSRPG